MSETNAPADTVEAAIDEYLDGYEFESDEGSHSPGDFERFVIKDAIMGLLVDPDFISAFSRPSLTPAPLFAMAGYSVRYDKRADAFHAAIEAAVRSSSPAPSGDSASADGRLPDASNPAPETPAPHGTGVGSRQDPLYAEACRVVREHRRGSISTVQRYLRIGYNRAAGLLEAMVGDVIEEMPPTTKIIPLPKEPSC